MKDSSGILAHHAELVFALGSSHSTWAGASLFTLPIITDIFSFVPFLLWSLHWQVVFLWPALPSLPCRLALGWAGVTLEDSTAEGERGQGLFFLLFSSLFWHYFSGNFRLWQVATPSYLQFLLDPGYTIDSLYPLRIKSGNNFWLLIISMYPNIPCFFF